MTSSTSVICFMMKWNNVYVPAKLSRSLLRERVAQVWAHTGWTHKWAAGERGNDDDGECPANEICQLVS